MLFSVHAFAKQGAILNLKKNTFRDSYYHVHEIVVLGVSLIVRTINCVDD